MYSHDLHNQHLEELVNGSGINLDISKLNFKSLQGNTAYQYLLISEHLPRTNTGMVRSSWLQRYEHIADGGWWCSGLDPLNHWKAMEWGCFKPNQPRMNENCKSIKYEHPRVLQHESFVCESHFVFGSKFLSVTTWLCPSVSTSILMVKQKVFGLG